MNDALTIKLCTSKKKTKNENLYFGQLPQMTSWKKNDSQMSHFRSPFFRVFVKVSLKVTLKTKQKIKPTLPPLLLIEWMCSRRKVIVSDTSFERPCLFFVSFCNFFWKHNNQINKKYVRNVKKKQMRKEKRKPVVKWMLVWKIKKRNRKRQELTLKKKDFLKSSCWRAQY